MSKRFKQKDSWLIRTLKSIVVFFDTIIITPISKFIYFILDKLSINKGTFEKFLNKSNTLLYLSLIFAFLCFILVDTKVITLKETKAVVISNQTVSVEYNDEAYVVEGIPKNVDIILMGRTSDLYLAEQLGKHEITLDLSDCEPGQNQVKLKYNNPIKSLDYKLDPSTINVTVYPKVSEVRTVTKDIINTDKLGETLVVSNVILDRDEVIVKSYDEKLEKVASVKALVDVNSINAASAGTFPLENVKLVAYDDKGTEIEGIEIVPKTVTASVTITSPKKEVTLKIVPIGEVSSGSAIESIESSVTKVIVYADESILEDLNYIPVEIDVSGLSEDKTYQKIITKPNGARSISETTVTIKVTMEKETSKDFTDVSVQFENLGPGLKASATSEGDTKVTVTVKGVKSILDKLSPSDIKAYVDLEGLGVNQHTVPILIKGTDVKLTYTSKTQKITVNIVNE